MHLGDSGPTTGVPQGGNARHGITWVVVAAGGLYPVHGGIPRRTHTPTRQHAPRASLTDGQNVPKKSKCLLFVMFCCLSGALEYSPRGMGWAGGYTCCSVHKEA